MRGGNEILFEILFMELVLHNIKRMFEYSLRTNGIYLEYFWDFPHFSDFSQSVYIKYENLMMEFPLLILLFVTQPQKLYIWVTSRILPKKCSVKTSSQVSVDITSILVNEASWYHTLKICLDPYILLFTVWH